MVHSAISQLHPEAARLFEQAQKAAQIENLSHCWEHIEAVLTGSSPRPIAAGPSPLDIAQIAFAEQFAFSVQSVSNEQVDELLSYMSEAETWAFVLAIYAIDMTIRLDLATRAVL